MAIITEEPELTTNSQIPPTKPKPSPPNNNNNGFSFWFYFTLAVSLITLFFVFTSSPSPHDPKTWFLTLPTPLRHHHSKGRTIKVQTHPNETPLEVFTVEDGPTSSETILIVHGQGLSSFSYRHLAKSIASKGLHVLSVDLPGNGFSDKSVEASVEGVNGVLGRFWYVYSEIQEKGIFWAFDQIVETGEIPYEEIQARMSKRKVRKPLDLGPQEMGKVLGEVIDSMGLAPVHLVLHDSALGFCANWVSERAELVRSVTLIDAAAEGAFPVWVVEVPVVREVVLGVSFVYAKVVGLCCSGRVGGEDLDALRVLLKGRDGGRAVVNAAKRVNSSFDLAEWGEGLSGVPMQVLWSAGWSPEWSREGDRVAKALPRATFVTHSGCRWAQEDVADEIGEKISQFVLSLPKSARKVEQESIPDHIQKMLDDAKSNGHDHHHHHSHDHGHGHDEYGDAHIHGANYMDAYGLGHGPHGW
ncbi:protein AUXIN RESPONSE 4 [Cajanus cajan]|nr:protein AUXIN RESPONSE 4 [Cajanus cajan]